MGYSLLPLRLLPSSSTNTKLLHSFCSNFDRTPRTTMFRNTMITMPLIASLAAGLTPQAKNLIRRFAEQGAYTTGQTTPPVPKSRRRLPVKAIDLKDALSKAENLVGALKRLKTPTKRGRVPPPPPKSTEFTRMQDKTPAD